MRILDRISHTPSTGKTARRSRLVRTGVVCLLLAAGLPVMAGTAQAQTAPQTVVSLTFNDSLITQYTNARPILQAHNMNATFYLASGWINKSSSAYYAWWQADNLYRDGNEIGGMGVDHKDLTQVYNADWTQDYAYKKQQVCDDFNWLAGRGYDPWSFAYPAGAYNYNFPDGSNVRGIVRTCGYRAGRAVGGFSPAGPAFSETLPPKDAYAVRTLSNTATSPIQLSSLQNAVNTAAAKGGGWVPLVFNQVCKQGDANYSTCMSSSKPIDSAVFSQFLDWLANSGQAGGAPANTVVRTVRKAMGGPDQPPLPQRTTTISLTFDDGDATHHAAAGQLRSRNLRGTFYINSGPIDAKDNTYLTWAQVTSLAGDGHEIGGHTVNHISMKDPNLTYEQKRAEVCNDRQRLIQQGFDPVSFAYPFGAFDQTAQSIVQSCGYQSGRTAGSVSPNGPLYAETIPPRDPYATRMLNAEPGTDGPIRLAYLQDAVTATATHGGGWLQMLFHQVCVPSSSDYSDCMAGYRPIDANVFGSFLDWLQNGAPPATTVKTVRQVMSGG